MLGSVSDDASCVRRTSRAPCVTQHADSRVQGAFIVPHGGLGIASTCNADGKPPKTHEGGMKTRVAFISMLLAVACGGTERADHSAFSVTATLPARSDRLHAGTPLGGQRAVREHGPLRPLRRAARRLSERARAGVASACGQSVRRRTRPPPRPPLSAHLGIRRGLHLRRGNARSRRLLPLRGAGLGTHDRRQVAHHERRLGLAASRLAGDLQGASEWFTSNTAARRSSS